MKRTHHLLTLACTGAGVSALVWGPATPGLAQERTKSPVTLAGVRVAEPTAQLARGALNVPNFDPFGDTPKASPPAPSGKGGGFFRGFPGEAQPRPLLGPVPPPTQPPQPAPSQPTGPPPANKGLMTSLSNWGNDRMKSMRSFVSGQPTQPQPRVGQIPQPTAALPPVATQPQSAAPLRGTLPNGNPAIAGRPAYRWYGWGTTTPGQNPYAPSGEYPTTSAQWYAMSGATPGAFPVPVTNPFRPPPGYEPAQYATLPSSSNPMAGSPISVPPVAFEITPSGPRPIAETPPFSYTPGLSGPPSSSVPSVPSPTTDWRSTAPTSPSAPLSSVPKNTDWQPVSYQTPITPTRQATDPTWQPVVKPWPAQDDATAGPRVRSQMPEPPSLTDRVRQHVGISVREVEVKRLGTKTVIVRFNAPSAVVAQAAANVIAAMPEFQADTVTFDVVIGN